MSDNMDKLYLSQREYDSEIAEEDAWIQSRDEIPWQVEKEKPQEEELSPEMNAIEQSLQKSVRATGEWVSRLPENAAAGALKAGMNLTSFLTGPYTKEIDDAFEKYIPGVKPANDAVNSWLHSREEEDPATVEIMQWLVPMTGYYKGATAALKFSGIVATKGQKILAGYGADVAANYLNMDPHMTRLSKIAQEYGIENEVIAYLASEEGGDEENRLRNVLDQVGLPTAAILPVYAGIKMTKAAWRNKEAIGEVMSKTMSPGGKMPEPQIGAVGDLTKTGNVEKFAKGLEEKYDLKSLSLYNRKDTNDLVINMIEVKKEAKKQGIGTKVMEEIIEKADAGNQRVVLTVGLRDELHGTTSRSRLVKFYKRFGFVENKGRNKDFTISEGMYRPVGGSQ